MLLREGDAATLIGVGPTVGEAIRAGEMLAARGTEVRVLDMHTIKPIDEEAIVRASAETRLIVTIEEHTVVGGLGGAVAEVLADKGAGTPLKRLGLQDRFAVMSGSREDFRGSAGSRRRRRWRRFWRGCELVGGEFHIITQLRFGRSDLCWHTTCVVRTLLAAA